MPNRAKVVMVRSNDFIDAPPKKELLGLIHLTLVLKYICRFVPILRLIIALQDKNH